MILLPPTVVVDLMKSNDKGEPALTAQDLIGPIEAYRHGLAPAMHIGSTMTRAASEASAAMQEATVRWFERFGIKNLYTMAIQECANGARQMAGFAAILQLIVDPRIQKPGWEIDNIKIGKIDAIVRHADHEPEGFERYSPFMREIRFTSYDSKTGQQIIPVGDPVYLPSPNSGHPPEYVDETVKFLLESGRDVRVIACRDAIDIPLSAGKFDLYDYASGMARIFNACEGKFHLAPVCQPGPGLAIALAMMAKAKMMGHNHIHLPEGRSIAWIANPMDTGINPMEVNEFATSKIIEWFDKNAKATVPAVLGYKGAGREIYYGIGQIVAFMMRDPQAHWDTLKKLGVAVKDQDITLVKKIEYFFGRRFLVPQSLPYELYRQTVDEIFIHNRLGKGEFTFTGEICGVQFKDERVDLGNIRDISFLCVQGEVDDITPGGQCSKSTMRRLFPGVTNIDEIVVPEAGHTGAFRGSAFKMHALPEMLAMFSRNDSPGSPKKIALQPPRAGYGLGQAA